MADETKPKLVFGVHSSDDADKMWADQNRRSVNPAIDAFGKGPRQEQWRSCRFIRFRTDSRNRYRCRKREGLANGKGEHRIFLAYFRFEKF